jgi:hypothetical protein
MRLFLDTVKKKKNLTSITKDMKLKSNYSTSDYCRKYVKTLLSLLELQLMFFVGHGRKWEYN